MLYNKIENKTELTAVRFKKSEMKKLLRIAHRQGLRPSQFIRACVNTIIHEQESRQNIKDFS